MGVIELPGCPIEDAELVFCRAVGKQLADDLIAEIEQAPQPAVGVVHIRGLQLRQGVIYRFENTVCRSGGYTLVQGR